ncbi:MAG: Bro-N domain-containing protein [Candidatus Competibacter sp.]|nr:Bro-N domain-containing protein [Candidatus Competibacter sp.]
MSNDLITFEFVTQSVRVLIIDGEPWFVAVDVCAALHINNNRMALERLDDDEKGVSVMDTPGGPQKMSIINESGLYALILTSRKPEAKKFKKWVTSEVLPTLRKQGHYTILGADEPVFKLTQQDLTDLIERCVERGVNAALRARKTIIEPATKPRSTRENFSEWEKAEILRLDEQGVGAAEIADLLYRPVSSVRSFLWRNRQAKRVYN